MTCPKLLQNLQQLMHESMQLIIISWYLLLQELEAIVICLMIEK